MENILCPDNIEMILELEDFCCIFLKKMFFLGRKFLKNVLEKRLLFFVYFGIPPLLLFLASLVCFILSFFNERFVVDKK